MNENPIETLRVGSQGTLNHVGLLIKNQLIILVAIYGDPLGTSSKRIFLEMLIKQDQEEYMMNQKDIWKQFQ